MLISVLRMGGAGPENFPVLRQGRPATASPIPSSPTSEASVLVRILGPVGSLSPDLAHMRCLASACWIGEAPVGAAVNETSAAIFHSKRQEGTLESFQESPRDFLWDSSLFPETISKLFIPSCLSPFSPYSYSVGPGRLESRVPIWQGCVEVSPGGNRCPSPSLHLSTFI